MSIVDDKVKENVFPVKSPEASTHTVQKRASTTPLTPSTAQPNITRRKLATKPPQYLDFESPVVLECKLENWMVQQELNYAREVVSFLELERQFAMEN